MRRANVLQINLHVSVKSFPKMKKRTLRKTGCFPKHLSRKLMNTKTVPNQNADALHFGAILQSEALPTTPSALQSPPLPLQTLLPASMASSNHPLQLPFPHSNTLMEAAGIAGCSFLLACPPACVVFVPYSYFFPVHTIFASFWKYLNIFWWHT